MTILYFLKNISPVRHIKDRNAIFQDVQSVGLMDHTAQKNNKQIPADMDLDAFAITIENQQDR